MNDQLALGSSLGDLIGWLETWRDSSGAYNGFVVHRTETKRMGRVHDTAWTQSAMIRGYGNLFRKSKEPRWGDSMVLAADLLHSRYDRKSGVLKFSGHEDDRFHSLVSCALGVCALLSITDLVDGKRRNSYISMATDHVKRYWLDVLWVSSEGAFKFTEIDYYSPDEDRFVVNFNTMAVEALLALYDVTGESTFRDRALQVGEWLCDHWDNTQQVNSRWLKEKISVNIDPFSPWMPPGGFSYQFTAHQHEPNNYVTLYNGLSLRGFWALYKVTGDERFAGIIQAQSSYILGMRDDQTHLFFHTAKRGVIEKNPQFVAGAGMTLVGLHQVLPLVGQGAIPIDTIKAILDRKHFNGSYPGFIGKNSTGLKLRNGGGVVWEDKVSSPNWNAQWFEYLTLLIEDPQKIKLEIPLDTLFLAEKRFLYLDTPTTVGIISWWPILSWGLFLYSKKRAKARISVYYPVGLSGRVRMWLKKKIVKK